MLAHQVPLNTRMQHMYIYETIDNSHNSRYQNRCRCPRCAPSQTASVIPYMFLVESPKCVQIERCKLIIRVLKVYVHIYSRLGLANRLGSSLRNSGTGKAFTGFGSQQRSTIPLVGQTAHCGFSHGSESPVMPRLPVACNRLRQFQEI